MTVTFLDRIKSLAYTTLINRGGTPVTREEHNRQRNLVEAAERLSTDPTERHQSYARRPPVIRHVGGGWRTGQITPPRTVNQKWH
jgi:hypothetical protein